MTRTTETDFVSNSAEETEAFAIRFAQRLKPGAKLALCGELGGGKTTFVRGIFLGLKGEHEELVSSPTFTLLQEYPTPQGTLFHLDLYRLTSYREFQNMDLEDHIGEQGMAIVEWGNKFPELNDWFDYRIDFEFVSENQRRLKVQRKA